MTLSELIKRSGKLAIDNSPTILTAIGVTGTLTTAFLTGRASLKAGALLSVRAIDHIHNDEPMPDWKEFTKTYWKLYIPAALAASATVAVIIAANRVGSRRAAALAAAYSFSEKAFEKYREKVVETIGAKKEQGVQDELARDRIAANPLGSREVIIIGGAESLCHDAFSGRYFTSDVETLHRAENDTNRQILHDGYASLTDLYYRIGLSPTAMSDEVGWTSDVGVDMKFSYIPTDDGRPCLSINFTAGPIRNYHKFS